MSTLHNINNGADFDMSAVASQIQLDTNILLFNTLSDNSDSEETTLLGPGLPPPDLEEAIRLNLLELAQSEPTDISVDLRLRELSKQYSVGIKSLRKTYKDVMGNYLAEKQKSSTEITEEERLTKEAEEDANKQWKERVAARAEQIAASPNISAEFQKALLHCCHYIADEKETTTILLTHVSPLLPHSMGYVIHGASSSGKSELVEKSAKFLPPEIVIRCTSFSNQALSYIGSLEHKYIIGGELKPYKPGEDDGFQQSFRQLISENRITRTTTIISPHGEPETKIFETRGPATFVMTTTQEQTVFNDEFVNRLSWLSTDDNPERTEAVLKLQAKAASQPPDAATLGNNKLEIEGWQEFYRKLRPLPVLIPFAEKIVPGGRDVTVRRLHPLLHDYIRTSALLNQHNRQVKNEGGVEYIVADKSDYATAYNLIIENAPTVLDMVSKSARKTYEKLKEAFQHDSFTAAKAQQALHVPLSSVKRHLTELKAADCVILLEQKEARANVYQVESELPAEHQLKLVEPKSLEA